MPASISLVSPHEVRALWPTLYPLLVPAIERSLGRYNEATVFKDCLTGHYTSWLISDNGPIGALVTQVVTWPTGLREGVFILAGGEDYKAWMPLMKTIEGWAVHNGCVLMNVSGRLGWEKEISKLSGWNKNSMEMVKCLVAETQVLKA